MGYSKAEMYGNSKLRPEDVRAIRRRRGEHPRDLAREYVVAPETIRKIWRGDTYTMISDEGPVVGLPSQMAAAFSAEEIAASQARMLAKLPPELRPAPLDNAGPPVTTSGAGSAPSLEELMRREFEKGDGAQAAASVERKLAEEDGLLNGLVKLKGDKSMIERAELGVDAHSLTTSAKATRGTYERQR